MRQAYGGQERPLFRGGLTIIGTRLLDLRLEIVERLCTSHLVCAAPAHGCVLLVRIVTAVTILIHVMGLAIMVPNGRRLDQFRSLPIPAS